jgi:AraC-like DNA-binding protein
LPAVRTHTYRTRQPDEAHRFLRTTYADNTVRVDDCLDGFELSHQHRRAGPLEQAVMRHRAVAHHDVDPLGRLIVGRIVHGRVERSTGGTTHRFLPGDVFLVATPESPYSVTWTDPTIELTTIALDLLADVGDTVVPTSRRGAPRFTSTVPADRQAAARLAQLLRLVTDQLSGDDLPALLADSTARNLATAVLTSFPNTLLDESPPPAPVPEQRVIRRAVQHIEAHADQPLTVRLIADAVHVAPRTLQLAFQRHLGTTPTEYVRRVRLDRAHHDLLAADPASGARVTDIALRWGFHHAGRFAAAYRRTYGRSPRATLQR